MERTVLGSSHLWVVTSSSSRESEIQGKWGVVADDGDANLRRRLELRAENSRATVAPSPVEPEISAGEVARIHGGRTHCLLA